MRKRCSLPSIDHVPGILWCEFLASKLCLIRWTKTVSDCTTVLSVFATDWTAAWLCSGSDEASASSADREEPQWPHWPGECYLVFLNKHTHPTYKLLLFLGTVHWHYCRTHSFCFDQTLVFWNHSAPARMYTGVIWGGHKEVIVSCHVNEKYCSLKPMMNATFFPFRALVMQWRAAGTNKNFFIDENRKADRRSRTDASCC